MSETAPDRAAPAQVSLATWALVPFTAFLLVRGIGFPPDADNLREADPLLALLGGASSPFVVTALSVAVIAYWSRVVRPDPEARRRGLLTALAGVALATVICLGLRALVGDTLPAFIPSEESAKPGLTLGLSAGLVEEVLFRLTLLPALYAALSDRMPRRGAMIAASLLIGLAFAVSHELGAMVSATELPFHPGYFVTRVVFPGFVMSMAYFVVSPTFVVAAHCTAHLWFPFLFN